MRPFVVPHPHPDRVRLIGRSLHCCAWIHAEFAISCAVTTGSWVIDRFYKGPRPSLPSTWAVWPW